MPVNHDDLVEQRGTEYGDSWVQTSTWINEHAQELGAAGVAAFPMVMIHNKLARALTSPENRDHFDDIIGYCKLALRGFEARSSWSVREGRHEYEGSLAGNGLTSKGD